MTEEEIWQMRQDVAFAKTTAQIALQMLLRILPVLVKQKVLHPAAVETVHPLLLHLQQSPLTSADDKQLVAGWIRQLGLEDPGGQ